jgi:hypothetical protein
MRKPSVWTDEMKATAAGMKRAGLSAKVIAARLGVSVGAVNGAMHRVGARRRLDGQYWKEPKMGRVLATTYTTKFMDDEGEEEDK